VTAHAPTACSPATPPCRRADFCEFIAQLEGIEEVRNTAAHAAAFAHDDAGVERFVQRMSNAERWIAELSSLAHDASR
jgi:hypothetical protein